jgi:HK97 family phage portal protein
LITGQNFYDWWKGGDREVGFKTFFAGLFGRKNNQYTYAKMLEGYLPVFSQFGQDIYASDVVQMAIDCIATEISKLQPRHIRTDNNGMQTTPKSSLNRLFRFAPNPIMTTRDFLEKVIWLLYMQYNAFIYPAYNIVTDARGNITREYTAFFPLNPTQVTFLQDSAGQLFIKMDFASGDNFTLNYADVIHLRKKFSVNSILGGGMNGQPDNQSLLKVLQINDTVLQGLDKAIRTSLGVRGLLKINTMLDDEKQKAERERFEAAIAAGKSGILAMDLKGEYVDLKPDPKIIDKETIAFIQDKILNWYGVPLKILSGNFNDEDYQAWYEKTLEPLIISLGQAFSKTLFTQRELDFGNEMVFYHKNVMYLSTNSKLNLIKTAGEQGLLTDNQKLAILGYPPLENGNRRTISLNYISTDIADEYQLKRVRIKEKIGGGE